MFNQTSLNFIFFLYLPAKLEILEERVDDVSSITILLPAVSMVSA